MDGYDHIPLSQHINSLPNELLMGVHDFGRGPDYDFVDTGAPAPKRRKGKLFNDPIHGHFRLDPLCVDIIDTLPFQRLRYLRQLGTTYYVFPGASHNRFEHSLGTCHLAYRVANQFFQTQRNELEMEKSDVMVAQIAGLCHDLGHGPFSHVFDSVFLKALGITDWTHEAMSCKILDHLISEYEVDISRADLRRIQELINPYDGVGNWANGKRFLFDIVSNCRNGVDVDKMDYLDRDAFMCGVKISFDSQRLLGMQKVIEDEICYKWSEYPNLYELYHSRALMHRRVYKHRKGKALELMTTDALLAAEPVLRLSERINSAEEFVNLDDSIIRTIETYPVALRNVVNDGGAQCLEDARKIIQRIRRRQFYRFCTECQVPAKWIQDGRWLAVQERSPVSAEDIASCAHSLGGQVRLRAEDLIVSENSIDFSKGKQNPLDHIKFFTDYEDTHSRHLERRDIMNLGTETFQERTLRVYSKIGTPEHIAAVSEAFHDYARRMFGSTMGFATPRHDSSRPRGGDCVGGESSNGSGPNGGGFPAAPCWEHISASQPIVQLSQGLQSSQDVDDEPRVPKRIRFSQLSQQSDL